MARWRASGGLDHLSHALLVAQVAAGGREMAGEAARLSAQHRQLCGRERPFKHNVAMLEEGGKHALHCARIAEPRGRALSWRNFLFVQNLCSTETLEIAFAR